MKQIVAVYEGEEAYARRLTGYLAMRHGLPFQVVMLTKEEAVIRMAEKQKIDVLLVGEEVCTEAIGALPVGMLVLLSRETDGREEDIYPGKGVRKVYKYQSVEKIVELLLACHEALQPPKTVCTQPQATYIGVYSPVRRCGKTLFSLLYGTLSARTCRTLYVSLDYGSMVQRICGLEGGADLADVLDLFEQGSLSGHLPELIRRWEGMDVIVPVQDAEDVQAIGKDSFQALMDWLRTCGAYERIILDAAEALYQPTALLGRCSRIFLPVKEAWMEKEKTSFFLERLRERGEEDLLERMEQIALPECTWNEAGGGLSQLQYSAFGDYVQQIAMGERA